MTEPSETAPALFGVPPGVDFPKALVEGLLTRMDGQPPEALARVSLYVNTTRMARRIAAIFDDGPPRLLPRIRLVTDLTHFGPPGQPSPVPPLRRRLELAQLVARLIAAEPDLAPASAAFDLAVSLAELMDEMQGEGVGLDAIAGLDVTDQSGHWDRARRFLGLVGQFLAADPAAGLDPAARQRLTVEALSRHWQAEPPRDPIIVAGSTGSRGTTALFMQAVARLPNGAVVLPGLDRDMPGGVWSRLREPGPAEDHPQYRFAALAAALGMAPWEIPLWTECVPPAPARNALVSLALRPAPVTDGWRRDGPALGNLIDATAGIDLIEAPDPRHEALAISVRLRKAVEDGETAALVTPDRMLTRRVTAQLDRWGILPDDSAGTPLRQTAAGRLVRHVAGLFGRRLTADALLVVLKHPLVHRGSARNRHLLRTRELERSLRRFGPHFPDAASLARWAVAEAAQRPAQPDPRPWAEWVATCCLGLDGVGTAPLEDLVALLSDALDLLVIGAEADHEAARAIWTGDEDCQQVRMALDELAREAPHGGAFDPPGFAALLHGVLGGEVRDAKLADSRVMIWGTLEARVQGAGLVVLGGLNEGSWPELPAPDPWLNRRMRAEAGLLLPERRIGLSAHDFQQAIAAPRVVLSRAGRDAEAETVPSRWLNRLTNLLSGLPDQGGPEALAAMRDRGRQWLALARALDRPARTEPRAPRPAPQPPLAHRPRALSVTQIETLIRNPYDIYARHILRLRALDPLHRRPEARDRGTVLHEVMERFIPRFAALSPDDRRAEFLSTAEAILDAEVPWPAARRLWLARLEAVADRFLAAEVQRQRDARPVDGERRGILDLPARAFQLSAKADRIDICDDGTLRVYDYKTGSPPSQKQQRHFAKQLLLEAAIAERAGFEGVPPARVSGAAYLGLNRALKVEPAPLDTLPVDMVLEGLDRLIGVFDDPGTGYVAQTAPETEAFAGDYLQLSRAGEWDLSDTPLRQRVGEWT
ncbi:MAG: double-strand break repair protein AddB [Rhodobacteraceae bacterium]|nr:double-strand break repair protein AddB [Paracoccaceae bacterium]